MAKSLPARFCYMPSNDLHEYCTAAAAHLLRQRVAKYPAAVEARKMTAEASANGMEIMRCILAQWHWVIDPTRSPLPAFNYATGRFGTHSHILQAELMRVADRADQLAARDAADWKKRELADLCAALAWYQHTESGDPRVVLHQLTRGEVGQARAA